MTVKKTKRFHFVLLGMLLPLLVFAQDRGEDVLRLSIGNEKLKDKVMAVSAGVIHSTLSGKAVSFSQMISEMKDSRFVFVGETHNSMAMHDIQHRIIQALHEKDKHLSIGLEMFPITQQEVLNKWSMGLLTEEEFIREAEWYVTWNFNFEYYADIFRFAKANKIPLYALNVPREWISDIRTRGWEALSEQQQAKIPKPDLSNEEHRTLIRTIFQSTEMPPQMKGHGLEMMFEGLYRAQTAWDEVMAHYAVQAAGRDGRRMVVLAGSGHLLYNLGINTRVKNRVDAPFHTVVCLEAAEEETVSISRSLADYVWGIPEESRPVYPSVGLAFETFEGLDNLVIDRDPIDGVALGQNFKKGDVVLAVDGRFFTSINDLRIYLSRFTWSDEVKFKLLRQAEEIEVVLQFLWDDADQE
jgi:uncharacterized iron-regulated protein